MIEVSQSLEDGFNSFEPVYITDTQLTATLSLLRSFSRKRDCEGVVYWFGLDQGEQSIVSTLIVPRADVAHGCISTSVAANAEVLRTIVGTPLVLLGQAHSHPGEWVEHSRIDDEETFARFDGMISVVVPFLAKRSTALERWGIHRHVDGRFIRVDVSQIMKHLRVIPGEIDLRLRRKNKKDSELWK